MWWEEGEQEEDTIRGDQWEINILFLTSATSAGGGNVSSCVSLLFLSMQHKRCVSTKWYGPVQSGTVHFKPSHGLHLQALKL